MSSTSTNRWKRAFTLTQYDSGFAVVIALLLMRLIDYAWPDHQLLSFAVIVLVVSIVFHLTTVNPAHRDFKRVLLFDGAMIICYGLLLHFIHK